MNKYQLQGVDENMGEAEKIAPDEAVCADEDALYEAYYAEEGSRIRAEQLARSEQLRTNTRRGNGMSMEG